MLLKKMFRDMRLHKGQFVSIFLMAFLAVFIYAGVGAEWRGLQKSADDFYRDTNLADVWVYGNGFPQSSAVAEIDGITSVERRVTLTAIADFDKSPQVELNFVERGAISAPLVVDGEEFDADDADGVWLDERFADAHELTPGDTLTLTASGITLTKTVRGLVYLPERVFLSESGAMTPDFAAYGCAFLSYKAFPMPEYLTYSTLLIKTSRTDFTELELEVSAALDGKYGVFLARENHPSVAMFRNETSQHKMMGDIFPIVFLAVALLTMITTMTRIVANQRIQIGTLKALGFKRNSILRHYISYGFFLALFGAVLGLIIGPATLPYLFYPSMSSFYTLPTWKPAFHPAFLYVSCAIVVLCVGVTYLVCGRLLRDTPAETLRPKAPKIFRHGLLEHTAIWSKLGFNAQWNIRDASRNKVRSAMAIIGVFGCTALIVCALSMNHSMEVLKVWQYEITNKYESKLILGENSSGDNIDGEPIMEDTVEIRAGGVKKSGAILVTDNTTLIANTDMNLNP
ncbi:MAG: ABC transporter permease, partial [Oscillospiraceae bacterium]|nr:ABC transporter permease [Oscillospiraceae bacterium]